MRVAGAVSDGPSAVHPFFFFFFFFFFSFFFSRPMSRQKRL
jgi:hypothetical protein